MIIDYTQKKDGLDISYVDDNNQIIVEEVLLEHGYYNYTACDDTDPFKIPNFKSFGGSSVKSEPSKYFTHHNINEFFGKQLPKEFPVLFKKTSKLVMPNPFSIDIETDIDEVDGYAPQDNPFNAVRSISFTDSNMNSILFIVKNPEHPVFSESDKMYIQNILAEALGEYYTKYSFETQIRVFDSESEMLNIFLECMNKYFHLLIGWNCLDYDWQYIYNRCLRLGIDVKKASPTRKLSNKSIEINQTTRIALKIPTHRIISDYMILFKESLVFNNLGSYSLDNTAELILNLNKVTYQGNLKTLYDNDYLRFVGYAFIDTILVMLIHKATNLLTVDFFQSHYNNVPYLRLSQNSISEALVYVDLREDNMFLLESEKTGYPMRKYAGGYVKAPTKKLVASVFGLDFKALYPNSMITMGLSPEAKIDTIKMAGEWVLSADKKTKSWASYGYPLNESENQKWLFYKNLNYSLSPMGRIYNMNIEALYTRIEKKLLNQRSVFQTHMNNIYLTIIPKIENQIKFLKANDK